VDPSTGRAAPGRRRLALAGAALAAVLVLLFGVWYFLLRDQPGPGQTGSGSGGREPASTAPDSVQQYGIRTVTDGCMAAGVAGAQARCAERAECWSGIVIIQGEVSGIRHLPCDQDHVWETYAIALVPPDVPDPYQDVLEKHPTVAKVCSKDMLLASRYGDALQIAAEEWNLTVLPPTPDDRGAGRNVYRCLGTVTDKAVKGTAFRPK
jgi:hypothetical protein